MNFVINESSINNYFDNIHDAKNSIEIFIQIMFSLDQKIGLSGVNFPDTIYYSVLTNNYRIYDWLNDSSIEKKYKDKFRSILSRGKSFDVSIYDSAYFNVDGDNSYGCLFAYEHAISALSFIGNTKWMNSTISGMYLCSDDDVDSEIQIEIPNISRIKHLEYIQVDENFRNITNVDFFWGNKSTLFRHLQFCDCVREQLQCINQANYFMNICEQLNHLDQYFSLHNGDFRINDIGHNARRESISVRNNPKMREERCFATPFNTNEFFEYHVDFYGGFRGRIYFKPCPDSNLGLIGYIGRHLSTAKY